MDIISDALLISGAVGAALYCFILSRRLKKFADLENGVGGAVVTLSQQVQQLNASLAQASAVAKTAESSVVSQTARAEEVARRLELLLASMHDLDVQPTPKHDETQKEKMVQ